MTEPATQTDTAPAANTGTDTAPASGGDTNTPASRAPINDGGDNPNAADAQNAPAGGENGADSGGDTDFQLPDEYKEASWASKVKSQDDLYKQLDNLSGLVGKKTIKPIDYETASDQEIADYHKSLAPEKGMEAYGFKDMDDPVSKVVGEAFVELGVNEYQGQKFLEKVNPVLEQMVTSIKAEETSAEGYEALAKEAFGDEYEAQVSTAANQLKNHASENDQKVFDEVDNKTRIAIDRTVNAISKAYEDRIQAILDEHGVKESGAQASGKTGSPATDVKDTQRALRQQIRDLDNRPHTAQEKQELINKLNATYK